MPSPTIVNQRPGEGDTDVSISTPFRFGVRDADTRADLSTVYAAVTFAKAVYLPDQDLPATDAGLADAAVVFSVFDDASGAANPNDPCDQTLEDSGLDRVYRVEHSDADGAFQEGMTYLTLPAQDPAQPYELQVTVDLAFVTADPGYAYTLHDDFVGVVLGIAYWPENTGLFLLFRDDGTKRISIVGPSTDGVGTRIIEEEVDYDWSVVTTYSIFVDPTAFRRQVVVYAVDVVGTRTKLWEVSLDDLNEFLPSVRMGNVRAEDSPVGKVTAVFGLDGTLSGNYIDVYEAVFANFGRVLVYQGTQTGAATLDTEPTAMVAVVGSDGATEWSSDGDFTATATSTALQISAETGPALYTRDEPDLAVGEWMLVGKFTARNAVHEGTYNTGMGFSVEDGTRLLRLSLLDDFSGRTIGVDDEDATDDDVLDGYHLPNDAVEWESDVSFALVGSLSRDALFLYVDDDTEAVAASAYTSAGFASSTETRVRFGFLDTASVSGDFYLVYLWVFPNCTFYESTEATYPDDQGWVRAQSGSVRSVASGLSIDCTSIGAYDIYSVTDATYDETSGAAVLFRAQVTSWTDTTGAVRPPRSEFGPVALVRTTDVAVQVCFVLGEDGTTYVYLSNEVSDVTDVLAQNDTGKAISAAIDLSVAHTYLLDVRPLQHVRLYVDYGLTPVIEAAWPASGTMLELPANVPVDAVVAFGSLEEDAGVAVIFDFCRNSIGRGYDFAVNPVVTETDLQAHVYGATASVLVDVTDED